MDSASDSSQDSRAVDDSRPEDQVYDEKKAAYLTLWVDNNGYLLYNMDWEDGEAGIFALSKIFYELCVNGYADIILSKMKEQCVLNGTQLEFESFMKLINHHYNNDSKSNETKSKEIKSKPVVSPDKSAYTI
tara:strand:+ start:1288 stop:1683 length:396 start_codon:yes stop_codon:yes gene_type:complete